MAGPLPWQTGLAARCMLLAATVSGFSSGLGADAGASGIGVDATVAPPAHHHGEERGAQLCHRGLGAALTGPDVPSHLWGPRPHEYDYLVPIASICAALCMCVSLPCLWRLASAAAVSWLGEPPPSEPSGSEGGGAEAPKDGVRWPDAWLLVAAAVPATVCALKLVVVLMPKSWKLLFLFLACYEVLAFWCFMWLVFSFLGSSDDEILARFANAAPTPMWAVPPFGCFCRPCATAQKACARDIWMVRAFVWQFVVICPCAAALEMTEELSHRAHLLVGRFEVLSLLLAMYGLFALLQATHDVLPERRLHSKFWTLKGTFIANSAVFRLCSETMHEDVRVGGNCYTSEMMAAAWAGTVTAAMCVGFAFLSWYAFPVDDLMRKRD